MDAQEQYVDIKAFNESETDLYNNIVNEYNRLIQRGCDLINTKWGISFREDAFERYEIDEVIFYKVIRSFCSVYRYTYITEDEYAGALGNRIRIIVEFKKIIN